MIDQLYRIIRTMEKNLCEQIRMGHEEKCPFCKANLLISKRFPDTRVNRDSNAVRYRTTIKHSKDCELRRVLEDLEEWCTR